MNKHAETVLEKRIERTVSALRGNNFDAYYIKDKAALIKKLGEWMPEGVSCSVGGSVTLHETGVIEYLKSGKFRYLDRYAEGADGPQIYHDALSCDVYLTSSNAITESGELYNIDGNGNRVAAMVYGPAKVIVIAGANKIVKDIAAAQERKRAIAGPANAIRLKKELPCAKTGYCSDCKTPGRFCCHELVSRHQGTNPNRIAVLILPESYGF